MIKAIAIDDEPMPLEILSNFAEQTESLNLIATFSKLQPAIQFLETEQVDLIFLDIQMPGISGLEFYKKFGIGKLVIFTTAFSQYAIDGFELEAVDYLLKPFDLVRFQRSVNKVIEYNQIKFKSNQNTSSIFLKADYKTHKIDLEDILFVEGLSDYLRIFFKEKKPLVVRLTMKALQDLLPEEFLRVHRSYIVPKSSISAVKGRSLYIMEKEIPIGVTYWKQFERVFFK